MPPPRYQVTKRVSQDLTINPKTLAAEQADLVAAGELAAAGESAAAATESWP